MHFPFSNPIELNHGGYLNIIDIYVAIFGGKCIFFCGVHSSWMQSKLCKFPFMALLLHQMNINLQDIELLQMEFATSFSVNTLHLEEHFTSQRSSFALLK